MSLSLSLSLSLCSIRSKHRDLNRNRLVLNSTIQSNPCEMLRLNPLHFSHALCAHWNCCYQVMLTCRRTRSSTMSDGLRWTFCWLIIVMSPECMGTTTSRAFLTGAQSSCNVWQRLLPWWFGTKANHLRQLSDNCMLLSNFLEMISNGSILHIKSRHHRLHSLANFRPRYFAKACFTRQPRMLLTSQPWPSFQSNLYSKHTLCGQRMRVESIFSRENDGNYHNAHCVCVCVHMSGSRYVHRLDPAAFAPTPFRKR